MDCNYFKILYSHFNEKEVIFNIEYDIVLCTPLFYVSMYLCIYVSMYLLSFSLVVSFPKICEHQRRHHVKPDH